MESFFFDPKLSQPIAQQSAQFCSSFDASDCYGVFHEPLGSRVADHAVLFLYPFGQEYVRSHRAIRQLALNLERLGVPSLRFDYRGTGDSFGADTQFSLTSARQDMQAARALLSDMTGIEDIRVFAVRLGALIGLGHIETSQFHAWDPVLFGDDYLQELRSELVTRKSHSQGMDWVNGYPLGLSLVDELKSTTAKHNQSNTFLYGASASEQVTLWSQAQSRLGHIIEMPFRQTQITQTEWGTLDAVGGFINPYELLQDVEKRLGQV